MRRRVRSDSVFYYLADGTGNVAGLLNTSNQLVDQYRWRPFGTSELYTNNVPNRIGFHGAAQDGNFIYLRNRWYDPTIRRFISEDPIGLAGGINPYSYAGNNPLSYRDPSGLQPSAGGCSNALALLASTSAFSDFAGTIREACESKPRGGAYELPGIVVTGYPSPFSTPRSQGYSNNFGNRGPGAGVYSGVGASSKP
jgi:RHS repeat-associated protein